MEEILIHPIENNRITARLSLFIKNYNLLNHSEKENKAGKIGVGAVTLAEKVMVKVVSQIRKLCQTNEFQASETIPSIYSTRFEFADILSVNKKSIYNYFDVLIRAGIIEKVWHNSSNKFEVWMNQWILFGDIYETPTFKPVTTKKISQKKAIYANFSIKKNKNLPHTTTEKTLEVNNNYYNSGTNFVENQSFTNQTPLVPQNFEVSSTHDILHEKKGLQSEPLNKAENNQKDMKKVGGASVSSYPQSYPQTEEKRVRQSKSVESEKDVVNLNPSTETDLQTYKKQIVVQYWAILKEKFYADQYFSENHEKQILNLIWRDIFGSFAGIESPYHVDMFFQYRIRLIEKAYKTYLKRSWNSVLPPLNYLSIEFYKKQKDNGEKGSIWFVQEWIVADDKQFKQKKAEEMLNRAMRSIQDQKVHGLKGGSTMSKLQISVYWRERLQKFNDHQIIKNYENRLISINQIKSISVNYAIG